MSAPVVTLNGAPLAGITAIEYFVSGDPGGWQFVRGETGGYDFEAAVEFAYGSAGARAFRRMARRFEGADARARRAFEATERGCAEGVKRFWARYTRGRP